MANIEVPEETESVLSHGADGVGLYRSEFFFIQPGEFATEEEQYQAYSRVLSSMGDKPVTIRTIDLGGDKILPGTAAYFEETNPILGWRSIRFCMTRKDIFETQLRALLRASVHGNLRIRITSYNVCYTKLLRSSSSTPDIIGNIILRLP